MKRNLLSMSLMLASLLVAAPPLLAAPIQGHALTMQVAADPAAQLREAAQKLRNNDLVGLVRALLPPTSYAQMRSAYETVRAEPTTDQQRAEFDRAWSRLAAPDSVNQLMAEIEPKLAEARPQAAGALMMGIGGLQMAVNSPDSELSDEQRNALRLAIPGIQSWVNATDFLSSESMRQALTLITDAARGTGVSNVDQLKMLSMEEMLAKAGSMLSSAKQALRIYGLDINAIADTLQVEVLSMDGPSARVRTTITVFNAALSKEVELVLIEGRWYGKNAAANFNLHMEHPADS